ncbi:hypothetical protein C8J56DRAFT_1171021 [Mycena floridula]|nr:hypothetical protein C8J56DRAFT_1171021 [Mycena floridula]
MPSWWSKLLNKLQIPAFDRKQSSSKKASAAQKPRKRWFSRQSLASAKASSTADGSPAAALGQPSSFDVLPTELTLEIVSLCDSSSLAALCRVSKQFNRLSQHLLYQIVDLGDDRAAQTKFEASLRANPQYALWVKALSISSSRWNFSISELNVDHLEFISFNPSLFRDVHAVDDILPKTTELRRLSLSGSIIWAEVGSQLSFPHLRVLNLAGLCWPTTAPLPAIHFLNSHPNLVHLSMPLTDNVGVVDASIDLPNLITYEGPGSMSPKILLNSDRLRSVWLSIDALDDLARCPSCDAVVIEIITRTIMPEVIDEMFKQLEHHLPHLKCCMLIDYNSVGPDIPSGFDTMFASGLSSLKQLEFFGVLGPHFSPNCFHDSMIESWLESCPTLQECVFLQSLGNVTGRYKVVDGKAHLMPKPCRMEPLFLTFSSFYYLDASVLVTQRGD